MMHGLTIYHSEMFGESRKHKTVVLGERNHNTGTSVFTDIHFVVHSSSHSSLREELDPSRIPSMPACPLNNVRNDVINKGILCSQEQELDGYLKTLTLFERPRLFLNLLTDFYNCFRPSTSVSLFSSFS